MDELDAKGNSPLCEAVWRQDKTAVTALVQAGANTQHTCLQKIPETYQKAVGLTGSAAGAATGLSNGAMVGIGVGAAALIGGGVALAMSGGSGSKHKHADNPCPSGVFDDKGNCVSGDINNGRIIIDNTTDDDVYAMVNKNGSDMYNAYAYMDSSDTQKIEIGIMNRGNGNVYGMYGQRNLFNAYTYDESCNGSEYANGYIDIINIGDGNVYAMHGEPDKSTNVINGYICDNCPGGGSSGYITLDNTGTGDVYGLFGDNTYNVYATGERMSSFSPVYGSIKITNNGTGNIYGLFGNTDVSNMAILGVEDYIESANGFAEALIEIQNKGNGNAYGLYNQNTSSGQAKTTNETTRFGQSSIIINNYGNGDAYGIYANGGEVSNSGTIHIANTGTGKMYGIYGTDGTQINNSGAITISNTNPQAYAYGIFSGENAQINNTGTITILGTSEENAYGIYAGKNSVVSNAGIIKFSETEEGYKANTPDDNYIAIDGVQATGCYANEYGVYPDCKPCPTGSTSAAGTTSITGCTCTMPGYIISGDACVDPATSCSVNQYWNGTACVHCQNGGTSAGGNATACSCFGNWNGTDCSSCSLTGPNVNTSTCTCDDGYVQSGKNCVQNSGGGSTNITFPEGIKYLWEDKSTPSNGIYEHSTDLTITSASKENLTLFDETNTPFLINGDENAILNDILPEDQYEMTWLSNYYIEEDPNDDDDDDDDYNEYAPLLYVGDTSGGLTLKNSANIVFDVFDDNAEDDEMTVILSFGGNVWNTGTIGSDVGCEGYPLSSCPEHGVCASCNNSLSGKKYQLIGCTGSDSQTNYVISGNSCIGVPLTPTCSGVAFPFSSCPENAICGTCSDATGNHYSVSSCNDGYVVSGSGLSARCDKEKSIYSNSGTTGIIMYSVGHDLWMKNEGKVWNDVQIWGLDGRITVENTQNAIINSLTMMGDVVGTNYGIIDFVTLDGNAQLTNKGNITNGIELFRATLINDETGIILSPYYKYEGGSENNTAINVMGPSTLINKGTINGDIQIWAAIPYIDETLAVKNIPTRASLDFQNTGVFNGNLLTYDEDTGSYVPTSITNSGTFSVAKALNVNDFGGTFEMAKNGVLQAEAVLGDIQAASDLTTAGFDTVYTSQNAIQAKDDGINLTSGSYLFNASLNSTSDTTHDIVMTMKSFDDVTSNKSLAAFLEQNYVGQNNEAFFNELKSIGSAGAFTSALHDLTAVDTMARFAHEDLTALRDVNLHMNALMFANNDNPVFQNAGTFNAFSFQNDSSSSAQFALAHKRVSPYAKIGYAMSTTHLNSDNRRNTTRRNDIFQAFTPIGYDRFGWQLISTPQIGFARAHYTRKGYNGASYDGVMEKRIVALMNEARYPMEFGPLTVAPTVEFNALFYNQKGNETKKAYSLTMPSDNKTSVEAGVGFHADTRFKDVSFTAGIMFYREFADPYNMKLGMNGMDGSFDLFDEQKKYRGAADFGFGYHVGPFNLYGSLRHFIETQNRTQMKAGLTIQF